MDPPAIPQPNRATVIRLYNKKTGQAATFTPEDAHAKFLGGEWGPRNDQVLPVALADGQMGTIKGADLDATIRAGGQMVTGSEMHRAEMHEKFGGIGGGIGAAAAGAARGLTLGISDQLLASGSEERREALAAMREEHPYASIGGELAGAVAPTLFSGGAAAGLEGANVARGVAGAARAAEVARGAAGAARAAEGIGAARGAAAAAGAAREAGIVGRGIRAVGALPRAVAGAGDVVEHAIVQGLGEGGGLARRAFKSAVAMGARGTVEGAAYGAGGVVSESALGEDHDLSAEKLLAGIGHGALYGAIGGAGAGAATKLGGAALGRLGRGLTGVAEENAWRVTGGRKAFTTAANKIPGGTKAIGRSLLEDAVIAAGDDVAAAAPKIARWADAKAERLGETFARVGSEGIPIMAVLDKMEARAAQFDKMLEHHAAAKAVRSMRHDLGTMFGALDPMGAAVTGAHDLQVPLKALLDQRRIVERTINWQTEAVLAQGRRAGSRTIEDAITEHGDELAKLRGDSTWKKDYQTDKLAMRRAIVADDAARDSIQRVEANRQVSPSDYLTGIGGVAAGSILGGPVGALKGAALAFGHKLVRERGNATAAVLLDKLANMGAMKRVMMEVDTKIDDGIAGFLSGKKPQRARAHTVSGLRDDYEKKAASVKQAMLDPSHARDALEPVVAVAPKTGTSMTDGVTRATTFLASKVPPGHDDPGALQPQFQQSRVSDAEAAKFLRYWRGVHDPGAAIDRMKSGTLSREEVEAMKAVYPKMYDEVRTKAIGAVVDLKRPLSYQQKVQLGILLDFPADRTMSPEFLAFVAKSYGPPTPPPNAPTTGSKPLPDMASSYMTATQQSLEQNKV